MCGIAGIFSPTLAEEERRRALERMLARMEHRGPDDAGQMHSGPLSMGMRRLAIFDPAHGQQPFVSADGQHHIIFNGSVYNHAVLRKELEGAGHTFSTHCDTEVLLKGWITWGRSMLNRLRGMFAFAIWNEADGSLVLARDPLGIKPLYFSCDEGRLLFASELNALVASGHFDTTIDLAAVDAFLARLAVPAPGTIYQHAQSLRPAEMAVWQEGKLTRSRYWQLPKLNQTTAAFDSAELDQELRRQLEDSIAAHQIADIPVGAFLSGGVDSAVVTGLMAQSRSEPLHTFSIGFQEEEVSEAAQAAETARHFGTRHQTIIFTADDAQKHLPNFIRDLDQPTGDGFNTFVVSQAARQGGMTAALSGLGGDELFGGYPSFRNAPRLARMLPWWRALPEFIRQPVLNRWARGDSRQAKLAGMLRHAQNIDDLADRQRQVLHDEVRAELLSASSPGPPHPAYSELRELTTGRSPQEVVSWWETRTYMTDVLLRDSDVFSMRASLELRVPFVDRPLLEWLARQPSAWRFDSQSPKGTLVRAVADILPPGLLNRPKQGFSFPFAQWMRNALRPFMEDTLSANFVARTGIINPTAATEMWKQFCNSTDDRQWSRAWSLAMLVAFLNRSTTDA